SVADQLQYCRDNVIRVNAREGTYTPEELRSALSRFLHRNKLMRNLAKLRPLLPHWPLSWRALTDRDALRRALAARVELLGVAARFAGRAFFRSPVTQAMTQLSRRLAAAVPQWMRWATTASCQCARTVVVGLRVTGQVLGGLVIVFIRL